MSHDTRRRAATVDRSGVRSVRRPFDDMLGASNGAAQQPQRCLVMGVLNVTPDSFSDAGRYLHLDSAVAHGHAMVKVGADIIDIGGESTRPGAQRISASEELRRVLPVANGWPRAFPVCIDTMCAELAVASVSVGAQVVNDVIDRHSCVGHRYVRRCRYAISSPPVLEVASDHFPFAPTRGSRRGGRAAMVLPHPGTTGDSARFHPYKPRTSSVHSTGGH